MTEMTETHPITTRVSDGYDFDVDDGSGEQQQYRGIKRESSRELNEQVDRQPG